MSPQHPVIDRSKKIAIVLGGDDILGTYLQYLLTDKDSWQVISICVIESIDAVVQEIIKLKPDAVIVSQNCCRNNFLTTLRLLIEDTGIKVISINLENNFLNVYYKEKILITKPNDLIAVLDNV